MRITNTMMTNTTLININRNMRHLDRLIQQLETTKKIQTPSDDPIVASRALKFRTNVAEIEQFQRNVQSGMAWMEVSEAAFMNITREVFVQIKENLMVGATGTPEYPDKLAIIAAISGLKDQISLNMNQTYAGRYVFSGFRTDQPPILVENNNKSYIITQTFDARDIEKTIAFWKDPAPPNAIAAKEHQVNILKLAYKDMPTPEIPGYNVVTMNLADEYAYNPPDSAGVMPPGYIGPVIPAAPNTIHYIPQTGELVMHDSVVATFKDGTAVTYQKTGFKKGELNPLVYFPCRELNAPDPAVMYPTDNVYRITQNFHPNNPMPMPINLRTTYGQIRFDPATGAEITEKSPYWPSIQGMTVRAYNAAAVPPPAPPAPDDRTAYFDPTSGMLYISANAAAKNLLVSYSAEGVGGTGSPAEDPALQGVLLQYAGGGPGSGFRLDNADPNKGYNMDGQEIQYEFATNTYVTINSLAKDAYTDKMYTDLLRLVEFAESLQTSLSEQKNLEIHYSSAAGGNLTGDNLKNAVDKHMSDEKALLNSMLHDRFNNMLYLMDRHSSNVTKEHTQMGSRMYRLELMQSRLEEDEASYTKLMSENEDTEMAKAIVLKAAAEAAFAASLRASANIIQLSLANFLN